MVRRHQFIFGGVIGEGKHRAIGKFGHDKILYVWLYETTANANTHHLFGKGVNLLVFCGRCQATQLRQFSLHQVLHLLWHL